MNYLLLYSLDQLIGICHSLNSVLSRDKRVRINSSITNEEIEILKITENYLNYRITPQNRLDRPYRIDIIQINGESVTLYFDNPGDSVCCIMVSTGEWW